MPWLVTRPSRHMAVLTVKGLRENIGVFDDNLDCGTYH